MGSFTQTARMLRPGKFIYTAVAITLMYLAFSMGTHYANDNNVPSQHHSSPNVHIQGGTSDITGHKEKQKIVPVVEHIVPTVQDVHKPGMMSAEQVRKERNEDHGLFLGSGSISLDFLAKYSLQMAQELVHQAVTSTSYKCDKTQRFGNKHDGGYDVCASPPFLLKKNDCLVYSVGIRNEWSFDDDINAKLGCEIHSFDPSMKTEDHLHKPNMFFHNLGLWGSNTQKFNWEMKDLETIVKMLNHTNRVIDYLKIDIEGSEWPLIEHLIRSDVHKQVKQMAIETHTPRKRKDPTSVMNIVDYAEIYNGLTELDRVGFKVFMSHQSNGCCLAFGKMIFSPEKKKEMCCYETFYINTRYI